MALNAVLDEITGTKGRLVSGNVFADNGNGADEGSNLKITALNGNAAAVGQQIMLESGALLTLNADGTFVYNPNGVFSDLEEDASDTDSFEYSVSGTDTPGTFAAEFNLSALNGTSVPLAPTNANGFIINGEDATDFSGYSVSSAGDVNGDGIDDLIIGAPFAEGGSDDAKNGQSYVVFGSTAGFQPSIELSALNADTGFVINGIDEEDNSGWSVSAAGDVNGDGIDDLIIGAGYAEGDADDQDYSGESYVVFGNDAGFGTSFDLAALNGTNGFVISGIDQGDAAGQSVSAAGDVNGDGFDDVIIGARDAETSEDTDRSGQSYVVFGSAVASSANIDLSSLDGSNGFSITGIDAGDRSGYSVSGVGDVNGDGIDDVIVGALSAEVGTGSRFAGSGNNGQSYVVFGSTGGFGADLELSSLNGSNGFVINGIAELDRSGKSVSGAGDVNGDGIDDIIIGANSGDGTGNNSGESYVVFGRNGGFSAALELSALNGSDGFKINGIDANDNSGSAVSSAGDLNGDGFDDLIIGARTAEPGTGFASVGETYVVFGSGAGFAASLDLSALNGTNGFLINGIDDGDQNGFSVAAAGDVNGDGVDDVIIGAFGGDTNGDNAGESYVIFGRALIGTDVGTAQLTINGSVIIPTITGTPASENVDGTRDTEIINALAGSDWITPGEGSDTIDGGSGRDMLSFATLTDTFGRTNVQYRLDLNIETGIAITSSSDVYTFVNIERITGSIFADRIQGDAGDNDLRGLGDYDWFIASDGDDNYDGGTGRDMISYLDALQGVTVNLSDASTNAGLASGDTYSSIERITGSVHIDIFYGDDGVNDFRGLGGFDVFYSSTGGRERYDGGNGSDTVTYANAAAGVIADLARGFGSGGDARLDLFTSIENLGGTSFEDVLTGDNERNNLRALGGDDFVYGGAGIDRIAGGRGDDFIDGGDGSDYILFDGDSSDFDITREAGTRNAVVSWTGTGAGDGTDTLINIEYMVFDDTTISIWSL